MMPSSNTSLPPELVDMIIQHLFSYKYALRRCALVSRTWSVFSQRALFRDAQVNLSTYNSISDKKMAKLLDDLISVPHLQTLIRRLTIRPHCHLDDIPLPAYMSCLASVLSLLPNLMKVAFDNDYSDVAIRSYLDLIPKVLGNAPLVELDINVYSVETFRHVFRILEGTNIKRVSLGGSNHDETVDSGSTWKRLHLPSLEVIHVEVVGLPEEFQNCLMQYFDLPNLKQFEIVTGLANQLLVWQDVLHRGFPPLEVFKLELESDFPDDDADDYDILEEDAYRPLSLAGLPFQHIHLRVNPGDLDKTKKFIELWSSTFRALSDSKATIHFTELTFTFLDMKLYQDICSLEEAWNSLDDSLAHATFSGVRNIHFERLGRSIEISQTAYYPVLKVFADRMRLVLPRLASRGVLRLD
ncbi:hypothetical protein BDZ89DRAFT_1147609 [Hymenopellis radicata]|nr:hypothetical protein BDZ89DRAFT_1147609 [Hymenopellis radicata]